MLMNNNYFKSSKIIFAINFHQKSFCIAKKKRILGGIIFSFKFPGHCYLESYFLRNAMVVLIVFKQVIQDGSSQEI